MEIYVLLWYSLIFNVLLFSYKLRHLISTGEAMQFIFSAGHQIRKVSRELRFTDVLYPDAEIGVTGLDVDSALQNVYWSAGNNFIIGSVNLSFLVTAFYTVP